MKRSAKKPRYDYTMLTVIFLLVTIGLILLYSTSAYNGMVKFQDPYYYLKKQGFATALGLVGMFVVARVDYHTWVPLANVGYLTAVALSVAVMLVGDEYNGSKRWLSLGPVSFQPSEFAKVALILFLACLVTKNVKAMGKVSTLVKVMIPVLPIVALVGASNLSTAIIILGIAAVLIFVASPKYAQFIWMGVAAVGFMTIFLALESYRLERLAIWRNPEKYEKGYQTLQGLYAIGSGGLFGRIGACRSWIDHPVVSDPDLALFCDRCPRERPARRVDRFRGDGAYDDPGDLKHCGRDKFDPKYRNHFAVYQLRRNIRLVFASGNGTCAQCIKSGKMKESYARVGRVTFCSGLTG